MHFDFNVCCLTLSLVGLKKRERFVCDGWKLGGPAINAGLCGTEYVGRMSISNVILMLYTHLHDASSSKFCRLAAHLDKHAHFLTISQYHFSGFNGIHPLQSDH